MNNNHPAAEKIPLLQRIFTFAATSGPRLFRLSVVHSSWHETVFCYPNHNSIKALARQRLLQRDDTEEASSDGDEEQEKQQQQSRKRPIQKHRPFFAFLNRLLSRSFPRDVVVLFLRGLANRKTTMEYLTHVAGGFLPIHYAAMNEDPSVVLALLQLSTSILENLKKRNKTQQQQQQQQSPDAAKDDADEIAQQLKYALSPATRSTQGKVRLNAVEIAAVRGNLRTFDALFKIINALLEDPTQSAATHQSAKFLLHDRNKIGVVVPRYGPPRVWAPVYCNKYLALLVCDVDPCRVPAAKTIAMLRELVLSPIYNEARTPLSKMVSLSGETALHVAVKNWNVELVKFLLRNHGDEHNSDLLLSCKTVVDAETKSHRTVLHYLAVIHPFSRAVGKKRRAPYFEILNLSEFCDLARRTGGAGRGQVLHGGRRHSSAPFFHAVRAALNVVISRPEEQDRFCVVRWFLAMKPELVNSRIPFRCSNTTALHICVYFWLNLRHRRARVDGTTQNAFNGGAARMPTPEEQKQQELAAMHLIKMLVTEFGADCTISDESRLAPITTLALLFHDSKKVEMLPYRFCKPDHHKCGDSTNMELFEFLVREVRAPLPDPFSCPRVAGETLLHLAVVHSTGATKWLLDRALQHQGQQAKVAKLVLESRVVAMKRSVLHYAMLPMIDRPRHATRSNLLWKCAESRRDIVAMLFDSLGYGNTASAEALASSVDAEGYTPIGSLFATPRTQSLVENIESIREIIARAGKKAALVPFKVPSSPQFEALRKEHAMVTPKQAFEFCRAWRLKDAKQEQLDELVVLLNDTV